MTDIVRGPDQQDCDGYTALLTDAGGLKAVRWLPMPMAADDAADVAAEWAVDTGNQAQLLYHGTAIGMPFDGQIGDD